jgi:hypothetical protein
MKEDEMGGQVVRIGEMRDAHRILVGNLKTRDHSENLPKYLKEIECEMYGTDSSGSG